MKTILRSSILSLILITLFNFGANAQSDYSTAIGLRAGFSQGLTIKHFIGSQDALEGIASFRYRGLVITGLYERHANAFDVERLNWYYGAGAHVGFWSYYDGHPWYDEDDGARTAIGIDGILGIEYNIREIPINISLDYKPAFNIVGFNNFIYDGGALSIRYMIP